MANFFSKSPFIVGTIKEIQNVGKVSSLISLESSISCIQGSRKVAKWCGGVSWWAINAVFDSWLHSFKNLIPPHFGYKTIQNIFHKTQGVQSY